MAPKPAPAAKTEDRNEEEVHITWRSPSRLFKQRDKEYFRNIAAIVFLLLVIFIFAREYMLVLAVLSVVFFIYVISTVPPEDVEHRLTNLGIESAGRFYRWEEMADFWYEEQWGQVMMVIRSVTRGRVMILIDPKEKERIREIVVKYVPFREQPPTTWMDTASHWLSEKIPLEKPVS